MSRDDLHFRLRIPEILKKRIETAAASNQRSMTSEIINRLEQSFHQKNTKSDHDDLHKVSEKLETSANMLGKMLDNFNKEVLSTSTQKSMISLSLSFHPGEILNDEFLKPLNLNIDFLAKRLNVPIIHVDRLVKGETPMTADMAVRLSAFFSNTPGFWMNLQRAHELAQASEIIDVSNIQPFVAE